MTFRAPRGGRPRVEQRVYDEDELIWGVPRRAGHDEQDDPRAHAGLTQHAFELGNDAKAICGFEPPKRASSPNARPRPQLAVPSSRLNPRCAKCLRLIATAATGPPTEALFHQQALLRISPAEAEPVTEPDDEVPPTAESLRSDIDDWPDESAGADEEPRDDPPAVDGTRLEADSPVNRIIIPPPPPPPPIDPLVRGRTAQMARRLPADVEERHAQAWEGSAELRPGQLSTVIWPGAAPGFRVVASVVGGPAGARVAAVTPKSDGTTLITLAEPADSVVTVAWFSVPVADRES